MSTFAQDWRCVTHMKLVSLRNKLRLIRLVWVTAVALQLLLICQVFRFAYMIQKNFAFKNGVETFEITPTF